MVASHAGNPFHRVKKWMEETGFWEATTLAAAGLELYMGHGGLKCPVGIRTPREMTIVHEHGISCIRVHFCECIEMRKTAPMPDALQLIDSRLFPASWDKPMTAFHCNSLKSFHLLTLQSQIMAHDYMAYLRRTTDNVAPDSTPVSSRLAFPVEAAKHYVRRIDIASF